METLNVVVKNYDQYLNGNEVEAIPEHSEANIIHPGQRVLVFKEAVATSSNVPVPKEKQALSIGVEGTVTHAEIIGTNKQLVKVKKI